MNQETPNSCLHTLIPQKMDDMCPRQQVTCRPTSSSFAPNISMSTLDLRHDCNLEGMGPPVSHFNTSTQYNTVMVDNTDPYYFIRGLPFNGHPHGASSIPTPVNRKNIPSPMGVKRDGEMVLSPEQDSTITTCSSGDGFSGFESFNNGPVFDSSLQMPHLLQRIPEVPSTLPIADLVYQQPYVQPDNPSEAKPLCYSNGSNQSGSAIAEQFSCMRTQLPPEPSYGVHGVLLASDRSALSFSSKGATSYANPSNLLHFSLEHKILCAYINYKNSLAPTWDSKVSFVNYLHSTVCNSCRCGCGHFCKLLTHFDDCNSSHCHICGPVQHLFDAGNIHRYDNLKRTFCDRDSGGPIFGSTDSLLPSSKRLKMEHLVGSFPSEVGSPWFFNPLKVQPSYSGALPPFQQQPESPMSITSEAKEVNMELSRNPVKDSMIDGETENRVTNNYCMLNLRGMISPKELIFGNKMEEINQSSGSEITENVLDSDRLKFSAVPLLHEELGALCKANDSVVAPVRTELDLTKSDTKSEFVGQEADFEKQKKSRNLRTNATSLTEFFTAEQIRVHISSLRQSISQSTSKVENRNKTTNIVSENSCQLCGAEKLLLAPTPIYCSYCCARIKHNVIYYSTAEENGMRHCFCTSCYKASRGGKITLYGIAISKAKMDRRKNDEATEEAWVLCDKCEGSQHQICALFNNKRDTEGKAEYICPKCCLKDIESWGHSPLPKSKFFSAKDIPCTTLSDHIEQRLFKRLQQEREKKAKISRKNLDEVPTAEDIVVRVVLSVDKQLKVKQHFLDIFHDDNYPSEFPYRSKVILLFQKIEGVDVCLFSMYVQEFGSECGRPNQRCIHISYLDSVKYFRPERETATGEALRTFVYHEILIGYLEYCKKRGFTTCYIWACPPLKGEDYILYCHPEIQKTPKPDKLRQWYRLMLRKAAEEKIIAGFTNLYDHFFIPTGECNSKVTTAHLPYFDGDYWSGAAEGVLKSIAQESGDGFHKKVKKPVTKRTLKAMGHADLTSDAAKDILFMQKLGQTILPVKEDFILVHLQFVCTHCHDVILNGWRWSCSQCKCFQLCERCHDAERNLKGEDVHTLNGKEKHPLTKVMVDDVPTDTKDKDITFDNSLFENRNAFLSFCQKNYYQFDTLRRAKHSSMMILHHLQNSRALTAGAVCSFCHKDTATDQCWLCEICPEFRVCATCYKEKGVSLHVHKLTQRSSGTNTETESKEAVEKIPTMQLMDLLQHASQCRSTKSQACSYPNCLAMKKLFWHARNCNVRVNGGCWLCKKAWLVLTLHSKSCKETDCRVPRCKDLKKHAEAGATKSDLGCKFFDQSNRKH